MTITHSLVVMEPGKPAPVGEFIEGYRFIASDGTSYKAPNLGQRMASTEIRIWTRKKQTVEGAFEGLTAGVNWRIPDIVTMSVT